MFKYTILFNSLIYLTYTNQIRLTHNKGRREREAKGEKNINMEIQMPHINILTETIQITQQHIYPHLITI